MILFLTGVLNPIGKFEELDPKKWQQSLEINFSNQMYYIAEDLLKKSDLDFEMLKPLIRETANKIKDLSSSSAQTGPAKRNDLETIKKQINLLEDDDLKAIYNLITAQILNQK